MRLARRLARGQAWSATTPSIHQGAWLARLAIVGDDSGSTHQMEVQVLDGRRDEAPRRIEVDEAVRQVVEEREGALWTIECAETTATLSSFRPPVRPALNEVLFLEDPSDVLRSRVDGKKLLGLACVGRGHDRRLVVGLASSAEAATWLTLWFPDGRVVAFHREGHRLIATQRFRPWDAARVEPAPNAIWSIEPRAEVVWTEETPEEQAELLDRICLPQTGVFEAWAAYRRRVAALEEQQTQVRMEHEVVVTRVCQDGRRWELEAVLSEQGIRAWLDADPDPDRRVRVSQTVESGGANVGTLDELSFLGGTTVRGWFSPEDPSYVLREGWALRAVQNRGSVVQQRRERAAEEALHRGDTANPDLHGVLTNPGSSRAPSPIELEQATAEALDPDQLRALKLILGCRDLVAIQGPPGTGKTRVITEAVRQLGLRASRTGQPLRVLLTSVQNEAVSNVAERLPADAGIMLESVHRRARTEQERRDFANRTRVQLDGVLERLQQRLGSTTATSEHESLANAERVLERVRSLFAQGAHAQGLTQLTRELRQNPLVPSSALDEADRLLAKLDQEQSQPATRSEVVPPPPDDASAIPGWWEQHHTRIPSEHQATLGAAVSSIQRAVSLPPSPRRARRLERSRTTLDASWAAIDQEMPEAEVPTESSDEVSARAHALFCTVRDHVEQLRQQAEGRPEVIAARFAQQLGDSPAVWQEIVARHRNAVAATCSMAAKARREHEEPFDWVIIDEAGRATPNELLIPMVQGKRVVLIGDERQLPPILDRAIQRELEDDPYAEPIQEISIFGWLRRMLPSTCTARLSTQYRMHEDIGSLVEEVFYRPHNERLSSYFRGARAHERRATLGLFDNRPLHWVEVPRAAPCAEHNPRELDKALEVVHQFLKAGLHPDELAVISPYNSQRVALQRRLPSHVTAQTIDSVQGREYDVVILLTTRTDGRPGFLTSTNRLNVAISRARRQLVVLGCSERLTTRAFRRQAPHVIQIVRRLMEAK